MTAIDFHAIREQNAKRCAAAGFRFAPHLPLSDQAELRPYQEILSRFAALGQLCTYVFIDEEQAGEDAIRAYMDECDLEDHLTAEESEVIQMPRAQAHALGGEVGWKLENMFSLAWVFGYANEPSIDGKPIGDDAMPVLIRSPYNVDTHRLAAEQALIRPVEEIVCLEDLYFCLHNAARTAVLTPGRWQRTGFVSRLVDVFRKKERSPVPGPPGQTLAVLYRVIEERRHALTWVLSPGTPWEETSLDT